jgi:hypothetical protein
MIIDRLNLRVYKLNNNGKNSRQRNIISNIRLENSEIFRKLL